MPSIRDEKTGRFIKQVFGKCEVDGCWSPAIYKGLCKKHYNVEAMRLYRLRQIGRAHV